ncbi:hypothetical protein KKC1_34530 [Calderihabitans maritimus]|uniref:Uncharacterized protein n=1 Tax=Calderihabitans maritimus TaxID=1246530 RepID=A0A1Z5HYG3_9FIRM|nr:hypothetical protein KKC1_34530 [Calderihabitans maritimus]
MTLRPLYFYTIIPDATAVADIFNPQKKERRIVFLYKRNSSPKANPAKAESEKPYGLGR